MSRVQGWRLSGLLSALTMLSALTLVAYAAAAPAPGVSCSGKAASIVGTAGSDTLTGTAGADVIAGLGGADRILGRGGNDLICAGAGRDVVHAGSGADHVFGQAGGDRLLGEEADDRLGGGAGSDRCQGGRGVDRLTNCEQDGKGDRAHAPVATIHGTATRPTDAPPKALADSAAFTEDDEAREIDVLANDADVGGGPKSIASLTQPEHGVASILAQGLAVTYRPDPGYCNDETAADSFTYTLIGGSTATVTVSVACLTRVESVPALSPGFDPEISDYTVPCDGSPLVLSGQTARGTSVTVDGGLSETGSFEAEVPLEENQEFDFSVQAGVPQREYHVRCLPADFPTWEYERLLPPSHDFYMAAPTLISGMAPPYAVIFDSNGVPVWWYKDTPGPIDAKFLADGRIAWWTQHATGDGYEIRNLAGEVLHTVSAVGGSTDIHEMQVEPNGDYLVISYQPREHVDLTEFRGSADATVTDGVIEEIDDAGNVVWKWSTHGHIGLAETGRWWPTALKTEAADIVHMNAVEPVGDGAVLISLRHTDAVYKIDKVSGNVIWKLGGTWTPKSLAVQGDPEGAYPLGGQHDVRLQPDGTITIHDNNTNLPDPPRAVRYQIDEATMSATMVEQVTDPDVPSSFCCGSARRSGDGSWLFSWGGNSMVTEFNAAGHRTFKLGFGGTAFSYRAVPAPDNVLTAAALRAGMDSMHPRP